MSYKYNEVVFIEKLKVLLSSDRDSLSDFGKKCIKENFTDLIMSKKYQNLYKEAVSSEKSV